MIICRKPWTIYDVDAVGAAGVVVFVLAAAWLVVGPWQRTWDSYRRLTGARTAVVCHIGNIAYRTGQSVTWKNEWDV